MLVRDQVMRIYMGEAQLHATRRVEQERGLDLSFIRTGYRSNRDPETDAPIPHDRRPGGLLGMTETFGTHSTGPEAGPTPPGKGGNWGQPMPGVERRIISLETGEILGSGQIGELQIRGTSLMRGYVKRERHEVLTADGYFPTGDRCELDEDGYLYFHGRIKDMIKTSGANVSPAEVEAAMRDLPQVREAIVLGFPDSKLGQIVVAAVVFEEGQSMDCAAIRTHLRKEISSYKIPRIIVPIAYDDVPRTDAAGKPKRDALRDLLKTALRR